MILPIAQLGQPVLRQVAAEVSPDQILTDPFQKLLADMLETLRSANGAGLAAPQVFASQRVFLAAIRPTPSEDDPPGVEIFINPRLAPRSADIFVAWEGCLSFDELLVRVPRHLAVRIDYFNANAEPRHLDLDDFPARVVQHEFDHLNGILTLDRALSTRHIIKAGEIDVERQSASVSQ